MRKPSYLASYQKKSKGSAMLLAILIIVILFAMGASLLTLSLNSQTGAQWFVKQQEAFYLAEAGIEHARVMIDATTLPTPQNGQLFMSGNLGNGSYNTFMWDIPGRDNKTFVLIRSIGQIGPYQSIVEATIKVSTQGGTIPEAPNCPCWANTLSLPQPYLCQRHPLGEGTYHSLEFWYDTEANTLERFTADARTAPNYKCRTSAAYPIEQWITQAQYDACAAWVDNPYFANFEDDAANCYTEQVGGELTVVLENFRQVK